MRKWRSLDLTVRDPAELLSIPQRPIYRWIEKKGPRACRPHQRYRLDRVELQEWANARDATTPAYYRGGVGTASALLGVLRALGTRGLRASRTGT